MSDLAAIRSALVTAAHDWAPAHETAILACLDRVAAELDRLHAAVDLHQELTLRDGDTCCCQDAADWPCPTVRTAQGGDHG